MGKQLHTVHSNFGCTDCKVVTREKQNHTKIGNMHGINIISNEVNRKVNYFDIVHISSSNESIFVDFG